MFMYTVFWFYCSVWTRHDMIQTYQKHHYKENIVNIACPHVTNHFIIMKYILLSYKKVCEMYDMLLSIVICFKCNLDMFNMFIHNTCMIFCFVWTHHNMSLRYHRHHYKEIQSCHIPQHHVTHATSSFNIIKYILIFL